MDILKEIQETIQKYDPEVKMEAEDSEFDAEILNGDIYQKSMDAAADPEDLNFSMKNLDDLELGIEADQPKFSIPQKDLTDADLKEGDKVFNIARPERIGSIVSLGELIEVEWDDETSTMEYPEELVLKNDSERL